MHWIDSKYVNLLSNRLEQFKSKGSDLYNFRCPLCGDSQKNKHKARGYIFSKSDKAFYKCHNCGAGMGIDTFLENVDPLMHKEYRQELFVEKFNNKPVREQPKLTQYRPKFRSKGPLSKLKTISQLRHDHPVKKYIVNRKIPPNFHGQLFYSPKFVEFVNSIIPNKLEKTPEHKRIVIPFFDRDHNLIGFQGRSLGKTQPRYITIMLEDTPKIYGLDRVDFSKKNYILEGPIDSMFVSNSIAMAGGDIRDYFDFSNSVYVYDNEPRSAETVAKIEKRIQENRQVFIWPKYVTAKDINEMIVEGFDPGQVNKFIDQHTHQGMQAALSLADWKKV